jgi:hypothetical protein
MEEMENSYMNTIRAEEKEREKADRKAYLHIETRGHELKKLSYAGSYPLIVTMVMQIIITMCDSMEKAYGIKSVESKKIIKKQIDKMVEDGEK